MGVSGLGFSLLIGGLLLTFKDHRLQTQGGRRRATPNPTASDDVGSAESHKHITSPGTKTPETLNLNTLKTVQ